MSNTKEELISTIKSQITTDNDIKSLSKQLKEKRNFKKQLTNNLVNTMKSNEIDCTDTISGIVDATFPYSMSSNPIKSKLIKTQNEEYLPAV